MKDEEETDGEDVEEEVEEEVEFDVRIIGVDREWVIDDDGREERGCKEEGVEEEEEEEDEEMWGISCDTSGTVEGIKVRISSAPPLSSSPLSIGDLFITGDFILYFLLLWWNGDNVDTFNLSLPLPLLPISTSISLSRSPSPASVLMIFEDNLEVVEEEENEEEGYFESRMMEISEVEMVSWKSLASVMIPTGREKNKMKKGRRKRERRRRTEK